LDELERVVAGAEGVVEIFGPTTAAPAIRAGLIEEFQFLWCRRWWAAACAPYPTTCASS
jgi:hypothetical protein